MNMLVTRAPHLRKTRPNPTGVMEDMQVQHKESDSTKNAVDEIIAKHFFPGDFAVMSYREKESIRAAIKAAINAGISQAGMEGKPPHPDTQEMLDAADAFERQAPAGLNLTRSAHISYPWGWGYVDRSVQELYRQHYLANKPKK